MKSFSNEFLKQMAIYTLRIDFGFKYEQLVRFEANLNDHMDKVAAEVIKAAEEGKQDFANNRFNKYIQN